MISLLQTADAVVVAEQTRMGLWQLFMSGGWLMWVLLILGGLTIFIFVERFMAIRKASEFDMNFMNRIRDYILDGKVAAAVDLCRHLGWDWGFIMLLAACALAFLFISFTYREEQYLVKQRK